MNIAIFTNNYLPNPYGVPNSIESFRKAFEVLGHTVYIFAPRWPGHADENKNVFRYPSLNISYKIKFPLAIPYSRKMDKILDNLKIDIIHSQHPNLLGSAAMKWAKKKNIPLVFTWHTLYDQYTNFVPIVPKKLAAWWIIRKARLYADECDAVITPTPFVGEIIQGWGVTNKNIVVIPTGVEEGSFVGAGRESVRKKYNVTDDETVLLLVTRFTAEKNVEFLFKAVVEVLRKNAKTKFLACGEGYLQKKLEEIVERSGLKKQVMFSGFISNDIKKDHYAAGDIFVYASKSETQGMILTEAMYSGLPIVAVRAPGAQDIVENDKTGFLVEENGADFAQAVEKLVANSELRKKFSAEAKKIALEKYTSRVCAEQLLAVYKKAIENFK